MSASVVFQGDAKKNQRGSGRVRPVLKDVLPAWALSIGVMAPELFLLSSLQVEAEGCFQKPLIPWAPAACLMDMEREDSGGPRDSS